MLQLDLLNDAQLERMERAKSTAIYCEYIQLGKPSYIRSGIGYGGGNDYKIVVDLYNTKTKEWSSSSCTCPDYVNRCTQNRMVCKHICAMFLVLAAFKP